MFVRPSAGASCTWAMRSSWRRSVTSPSAAAGTERALACEGPLLFTRVCSERRWERGSTVGVALNPEGCLVLGGDDGAGMAPADLVDLTAPPAQEEHARQ